MNYINVHSARHRHCAPQAILTIFKIEINLGYVKAMVIALFNRSKVVSIEVKNKKNITKTIDQAQLLAEAERDHPMFPDLFRVGY